MNDIITTDELIAVIKHTLKPYGMVYVDQVLAWLNKQADITRAECMAEEVQDGKLGRCCNGSRRLEHVR